MRDSFLRRERDAHRYASLWGEEDETTGGGDDGVVMSGWVSVNNVNWWRMIPAIDIYLSCIYRTGVPGPMSKVASFPYKFY